MTEPGPLTADEKAFLREVARLAVAAAVHGEAAPDTAALCRAAGLAESPRLQAPCGAFVTLHLNGELRGCIGYIEGRVPLVDAVAHNGRAAAVGDPRFAPVSAGELPRLQLEVSALTPLQRVARPEEIVVGRHGILLEKAGRSAVFLPQVATEQGWNLDTTLSHLALKAGLRPGDWREGARFRVFEADVF